jgi:hypothetical protein
VDLLKIDWRERMNLTPEYKTWTSKDGTVHRIKDMSTPHLLNTIKLLERQAKLACDNQDPQGVDIMDCIYMPEEFFLHPAYDDLLLEAEIRGLKV